MKKFVILVSFLVILLVGSAYAESSEVKTGLAVETLVNRSAEAGENNGLAQVDSVIVAVTVDEGGRITNCAIDSAQTRINFSAKGEIVTPTDSIFVGKQEMGEKYGMIHGSSIGKEWNEQANAFANYVIGKTVEEVKSISINEEGAPTEAELTSSVTMRITDYIAGIEKAVANSENRGAFADDQLGIGVVTTIDRSRNATADQDGLAEAYSTYAAITVDQDGILTSCIIDASQGAVRFNQKGKITSDLAQSFKTKNELGNAYGMIAASSIGKEWYEQADSFARYVVGKTIDEIKGIAFNEEGVPTEAELSSSVTMHAAPFVTVIEKAHDTARELLMIK